MNVRGLILSLVLSVPLCASVDDERGFNGINWGDPSTRHSIDGEYDGRNLAAFRKGEPLKYFGLPLMVKGHPDAGFVYSFDLKFGFYRAIAAIAPGVSDATINRAVDEISKALRQRPTITPVGKNRIIKWEGQKIRLQITVAEPNPTLGGAVSVTHLELESKIKTDGAAP